MLKSKRLVYPSLLLFAPPLGTRPLEFLKLRPIPKNQRAGVILCGENFIILTSTAFDVSTHVRVRRTDGRTGDS